MNTLKDIQVLIWDFDGTLYEPVSELWHTIREAEYRVIMEVNGWDHERAEEEFKKLYKKTTPSATQTVGKLTGMTTTQAALYMEKFYDRREYVGKDDKLVAMFEALKNYRHFILANGVRARLEETLEVLGVPVSTFEYIVTSEVSGENKPSDKGFRYILEKTKLPAAAHLMIGDRPAVDLDPAQKIGMKTCFITWDKSEQIKHTKYDEVVEEVYEISSLLSAKGSA